MKSLVHLERAPVRGPQITPGGHVTGYPGKRSGSQG
jgi:hypothetical protein